MNQISGPAGAALTSLNTSQITFLKNLPKAELHAHLNGSIPLDTLCELARHRLTDGNTRICERFQATHCVEAGLARLQDPDGVNLVEIKDFFTIFPAIYVLTSNPILLACATRAVLHSFLGRQSPDEPAQCTYLELRTTPRKSSDMMSREAYLRTVLDEVERYPPNEAALIVSLDRKMDTADVKECVKLAIKLREDGRRVVGVDLCGDPLAGDMRSFAKYLEKAKASGLKITLHIAETKDNPPQESHELLSWHPDRLGHATFLPDEAQATVLERRTPIEICLTSNLLTKTVSNLEAHHIRYYLERNHPIAICTDDLLPFRTSLLGEYALLLAKPPLGLGLTEDEVKRLADMSLECRFMNVEGSN